MSKFTKLQQWIKKILEDSWWIDYLERKDRDEDKDEEEWNLRNKALETILKHSKKDNEIYTSLKNLKSELKAADPAEELSIGALRRSEAKVFKRIMEEVSNITDEGNDSKYSKLRLSTNK